MSDTIDLFTLALRVQTEGIQQARTELEKLNKTGQALGTASKAQQVEIEKSTKLLAQMASLVDKNDHAAIANLKVLASAQRDWAREIGASAESMLRIEGVEKKINTLGETGEHASGSIKKLGNSFEHLASEMLGVNPIAGKLSATLGEMAVGGVVTVGILAGLAAIGLAYERLTRNAREAKEQVDSLVKSLNAQAKAQHDATREGQAENLRALQKEQADALANLNRARAQGRGEFGLGAMIGGAALGDVDAAKKRYEAATTAITEFNRQVGQSAEEAADKSRQLAMASDQAMLNFKEGVAAIFKRIDDKNAETARKAEEALDARIKALTSAMVYDDLHAKAARELAQIENRLTAQIEGGNLSLERRIKLEERLAQVQAARKVGASPLPTEPTVGITPMGDVGGFSGFESPMKTLPNKMVKDLPPLINESGKVAVEAMNNLQKQMQDSIDGLAQVLGDGIYNAFAAAFNGEGLGGVFKAFGKTVLAGLGQIFTQMGEAYLSYGLIMSGLIPTLANPFTAGPTAIAIGALLVALGSALGAIGKGAGRGTASAGAFREPVGAGTQEITRLKLVNRDGTAANMEPKPTLIFNVIGTRDAKAQREIAEMVKAHTARNA